METPDPEVLRVGTNRVSLSGDCGQQQPLCAVTRIQKEEKDECADEGNNREDLGSAAERKRQGKGGKREQEV
ncbi:hypothetical protein NDU88_005470 [Pleurodeles waltl]|uniref:Uncharacterized protein n=1 Tax=Pleurodeles waltl TaxID=8319 RepID=A0AAV7RME8_PLEWA|nr:hypothetical protein NDU88_005470 [Pleurodeles waltl]